MASKRVNKLAGEIVTAMLAQAGVTKSAGSTAAYMPYAVGLAESIVVVEKTLKRTVRRMEAHTAEVGRLVDANGEKIRMLADRYAEYAGTAVPSVEKVHRGVVDLDLQRFHVGLVDQQSASKMNGHSQAGPQDGPAPYPPLWHPETGQ